MTNDTLEAVRAFTAKEVGRDVQEIRLETSLFHDLGVDGADGWEFVEAFGKRFDVDTSGFEAGLHFGPEAAGNPFVWLWWLITDTWPKMIPITIADLVAAARSGRWQTPTHAPRAAI